MSTLIDLVHGFSLIATLLLALGIGAAVALALLFKPLLVGCVRAAALAVKRYCAPRRAGFKL